MTFYFLIISFFLSQSYFFILNLSGGIIDDPDYYEDESPYFNRYINNQGNHSSIDVIEGVTRIPFDTSHTAHHTSKRKIVELNITLINNENASNSTNNNQFSTPTSPISPISKSNKNISMYKQLIRIFRKTPTFDALPLTTGLCTPTPCSSPGLTVGFNSTHSTGGEWSTPFTNKNQISPPNNNGENTPPNTSNKNNRGTIKRQYKIPNGFQSPRYYGLKKNLLGGAKNSNKSENDMIPLSPKQPRKIFHHLLDKYRNEATSPLRPTSPSLPWKNNIVTTINDKTDVLNIKNSKNSPPRPITTTTSLKEVEKVVDCSIFENENNENNENIPWEFPRTPYNSPRMQSVFNSPTDSPYELEGGTLLQSQSPSSERIKRDSFGVYTMSWSQELTFSLDNAIKMSGKH